MQYNSTITSYDDQELHDKLEELRVLSTNISEQINHLHLVRNDHSDQLSQVNLRLTNLQTQINDIDWRLREVERKSSAAAFYRMNSTMIHGFEFGHNNIHALLIVTMYNIIITTEQELDLMLN